MEPFERHLGKGKFIEASTCADIDDFKIKRTTEKSQQHDRKITPRTINFEISVLRTFFYFFINERGLDLENACARFKVEAINALALGWAHGQRQLLCSSTARCSSTLKFHKAITLGQIP